LDACIKYLRPAPAPAWRVEGNTKEKGSRFPLLLNSQLSEENAKAYFS